MCFNVVCTLTDNHTCQHNNKDEEIKSHIVMSCFSSWQRALGRHESQSITRLRPNGLEMSEKQAKGIE